MAETSEDAWREQARANARIDVLGELAITVIDTIASNDLTTIESPDQVPHMISRWRDRAIATLTRMFSESEIAVDEREWQILEREIRFRLGQLERGVLRPFSSEEPCPATTETLSDLARLRQTHQEKIARVEDKGTRRLALVEFAKAVLDFGASRALERVQVEDEIAVFLEKVRHVLMAPFWMDLELARVSMDDDEMATVYAMIQSRLMHWEVEAVNRLRTASFPDDDTQHAVRVAKVDRYFGYRGEGRGKRPYCVFYKPLGVSASEFSNWKQRRWSKCGREKKRALDQAADRLA